MVENIIYIKKSHIIDKIVGNLIYPTKEWMRKWVEFCWAEKIYGTGYLIIIDD